MGSKRSKINGSGSRNLSSIELIKIDDMPEQILFEVLLRLPVKVLFKFKIVSKQWLSMISDPSFARMYVSRASMLSHSENWTLINSYLDKATSPTAQHLPVKKVPQHECSLGTNCLQHRLSFPCAQRVDDFGCRIVGVSNGLVLYDVYRHGRIYGYYICNLITEQWITLPQEHVCKAVNIGFVTQVEDNFLASYRVVRLDLCHMIMGRVFKFTVYFSEIFKWEDFDIDFSEEIYFYVWKKAAVLDKILHQMISEHRIMAYDPYNKPDSVRLISLPGISIEGHGRTTTDFNESLLDEHQGHLRYFVVALDGLLNEFSGSLSIWVLNDYDLGEWYLQHRVSIGDIQYDGGVSSFPVPLSFHPFDPSIVFMINAQALLSYDLKTRKLKIEVDSSGSYCLGFQCHSYYLFVIPPWPVSINPSSSEVTKD